jgi:pectate lyase
VLFFDDFEDGNADGWSTNRGDWQVVLEGDNHFYRQGTLDNELFVAQAGSVVWDDVVIEARVRLVDVMSGGYSARLLARCVNAGKHYGLEFRGDGVLRLEKFDEGNGTWIADSNTSMTPETWHSVRFEAIGSVLRVYVDGVWQIERTDSFLPRGAVGLATAGAIAEFDDVRVSSP